MAGTCYWDGTGPFCDGSCPKGYTECGRDSSGDGDLIMMMTKTITIMMNSFIIMTMMMMIMMTKMRIMIRKMLYNYDGDNDNTDEIRCKLLEWTQGVLLQSLRKIHFGLQRIYFNPF